jgi:hypothetical protein
MSLETVTPKQDYRQYTVSILSGTPRDAYRYEIPKAQEYKI